MIVNHLKKCVDNVIFQTYYAIVVQKIGVKRAIHSIYMHKFS